MINVRIEFWLNKILRLSSSTSSWLNLTSCRTRRSVSHVWNWFQILVLLYWHRNHSFWKSSCLSLNAKYKIGLIRLMVMCFHVQTLILMRFNFFLNRTIFSGPLASLPWLFLILSKRFLSVSRHTKVICSRDKVKFLLNSWSILIVLFNRNL